MLFWCEWWAIRVWILFLELFTIGCEILALLLPYDGLGDLV